MNRSELIEQIHRKRSFLCVGLDPDPTRMPAFFQDSSDGVYEFLEAIIQSTQDLCVAYKLNLAFFEVLGSIGWKMVEDLLDLIPDTHFVIADAKRGDIGNSSRMYARAFFETLDFNALTVAPYMGSDSVQPFFEFDGKWVILLALTSNAGSQDFQFITNQQGSRLFESVLKQSGTWGTPENLMFVTGATHPQQLKEIRALVPDHFLLIPGVGAQGGDLKTVARASMNADIGILVNSSRGILYAGTGDDFALKAREEAVALQQTMAKLLDDFSPFSAGQG